MVVNKNSGKLPSRDGFKSPVPKTREKRVAKKSGGRRGIKVILWNLKDNGFQRVRPKKHITFKYPHILNISEV